MSAPQGPDFQRPEWALSGDSFLEEMNKIPLFMSSMPQDAEENDSLMALQSLVYDGTPEEIAENFKNQGNDCFKTRQFQDAIKHYTQGLEAKCSDSALNEQLYVNRAAANLELQNYRKTINDCAQALKINPANVKAFYRSARALLALDVLVESIDCCERGLKIDPENKSLRVLLTQAKKRQEEIERKRKEIEMRQRKREAEEAALSKAIEDRHIKMEYDNKVDPTDNPHRVHIDPSTNELIWPVFFLYPEFKESDFIQAFPETSTFAEQLEVMFENNAPWDSEGRYTPKGVEIYFENNQGLNARLVKVGRGCRLEQVLAHPKYVVKNGVPSFIVLPTQGSFRDEFLSNYKN
ncbi:uncharacterized protein VTP21DRAFT_6805 [Calcarisporiella thermophila]|uniref:uncharacterized protein n=1 Tax=Calcarisporiella thermophila TaxID=911321 RepID=UPI003742419F